MLRFLFHFFPSLKHVRPNVFWAILNQAILSAGAACIIIVLSLFLNKETFGTMRYLASILAVLAFFSLPGIGTIFLRDVALYDRLGFLHAVKTQFQWGLCAFFGGIILGIYYFLKLDYALADAFFIGSTLAPLANLYLTPGQALAGVHRFKDKAILDSLIIMTTVVGAAFGAFVTRSVPGTVLFYYAAQSLAAAFAILYVYRGLPQSTVGTPSKIADIAYAKRLTLFQIPYALLPALDRIFIFILLGPVALAVYVVAATPTEHVRTALRSFLQFYVIPHLDSTTEQAHAWMSRSALLSIAAAFTAVVGIILLIRIIFPQYNEAFVFALLLPLGILPLPFHILTLLWIKKKQVELLIPYTYFSFVMNILLFLLLTSLFGLWGAIVANILFECIMGMSAFYMHRTYRDPTFLEENNLL